MDRLTNLELCKHLPFFNCSFFTISQMFLSTKDKILDKLEGKNFIKGTLLSSTSRSCKSTGYQSFYHQRFTLTSSVSLFVMEKTEEWVMRG